MQYVHFALIKGRVLTLAVVVAVAGHRVRREQTQL